MASAGPSESGAAYRQARRAAGISQVALAQAVGVSRRTIIRTEQGKTRPWGALRDRIAEALGVEANTLPAAGGGRSPLEEWLLAEVRRAVAKEIAAMDIEELDREAQRWTEAS